LKADCTVKVCTEGYSFMRDSTLVGLRFPRKGAEPTPMMGWMLTPVSSSRSWRLYSAALFMRIAPAWP